MAKQLIKEDFKQAFQSTTAQTQNLVLKAAEGKDNAEFPKLFAEYKWESAKPYDMALIIIAYYTYCMKSSDQSIKKFGFTARNTNNYSFKLLNNLIKGNGAKIKALMQPYFLIPMNKILETTVLPGKNNYSKRNNILQNFITQAGKITPSNLDENKIQYLEELIYTLTDNKKTELEKELERVDRKFYIGNKDNALKATRTAAATIIKKQQYGKIAKDAATKALIQPLHDAIESNNLNSVREIIENNPKILKVPLEDNGFTSLHVAVKYGNTGVIRLLLQQPSIDPNIKTSRNNNGMFPLWQAASHFDDDNTHLEITQLLLNHPRINPNIQDSNYERTALNQAAAWGNANIVRLLLPRTNNPNTPDCDGNTPLHNALTGIGYDNRHNVINQLLQDSRINLNIQNNSRNTALHLAANRNDQDIINLLLNHGANPDIRNRERQTYQDLLPHQDLPPHAPRHSQVERLLQTKFQNSLSEGNSRER